MWIIFFTIFFISLWSLWFTSSNWPTDIDISNVGGQPPCFNYSKHMRTLCIIYIIWIIHLITLQKIQSLGFSLGFYPYFTRWETFTGFFNLLKSTGLNTGLLDHWVLLPSLQFEFFDICTKECIGTRVMITRTDLDSNNLSVL